MTAVRFPLVVELEFPTVTRISRVVNVSRLKRFHRAGDDRFPGRDRAEDVDGNPQYEVVYIMGKRRIEEEGTSLVIRYLVKWGGV